MALYLRMLLNRGRGPKGRLVSEESFALFSKRWIDAPPFGEGASYGYGIAVVEIDDHTALRHTGGMVSYSSALHANLDAGLGSFASVHAATDGYRPRVPKKAWPGQRLRVDSPPTHHSPSGRSPGGTP
jgi:hypothetical protein